MNQVYRLEIEAVPGGILGGLVARMFNRFSRENVETIERRDYVVRESIPSGFDLKRAEHCKEIMRKQISKYSRETGKSFPGKTEIEIGTTYFPGMMLLMTA